MKMMNNIKKKISYMAMISAAFVSAYTLQAADVAWDGGGSDDNLRTADNWAGDSAPDTNDVLIFNGTVRSTPNNDFTADTQFNGLIFSNTVAGQSFTLGGNAVDLGGDITGVAAAGTIDDTISLPVELVGATRKITLESNHNLTVSGVLSGSQLLRKYGPGVLTLTTANTHSGKTIFGENVAGEIGGTINIQDSDAFGAGNVEFENNGTIEFGISGLTVTNFVYLPNRAGSLRAVSLDLPGSASGSIAGNMDIRKGNANGFVTDVGVDDTLTYSGTIATGAGGGAGITKEGDGTLVLTGNNTYLGNTTVRNGTLKITQKNALGNTGDGTIVEDGATLELNHGDKGNGEPITISGSGVGGLGVIYSTGSDSDIGGAITLATNAVIGGIKRLDHSGTITDNGNGYTLTKTGTFSLVRGGAIDVGELVINQGAYTCTGSSGLPGSSSTVIVNSSGTLTLWGPLTVANNPNIIVSNSTYQASRSVVNQSSINGTISLNGAVSFNSWATAHTVYSDVSGSGDLTIKSMSNKEESARYIFAGENSYSGSTTIGTGSSGVGKMTLQAGSSTGLSSNSAHTVTANSTLVLDGFNSTIGSLAGAGLVENGGYQSILEDDFSGAGVAVWDSRMREYSIDDGWVTRPGTDWTIVDGVMANASTNSGGYSEATPAESALAQMVSNSRDGDQVKLQFDYDIATGDQLYVHFWGYTGVVDATASTILANLEPCSGTVANNEDNSVLDAFSLKDGATTGFGHSSTAISGALTGAGTYTNIITIADLGIGGVESLADLSYIFLSFGKNEDGLHGTTTVDNVIIKGLGDVVLSVGADNSSTIFSGVMHDGQDGDPLGLTKIGSGTQTLSNTNSYTGATTVMDGTLKLGADDVLSDSTELVMDGGTLDADAATDSIGALNLKSDSTLLLGTAEITFGDSTALTWSGTLTLEGELGDTSLRFIPNITAEQRSHIIYNGSHVGITVDGYIIPLGGTVILVK